MRHASDDGSDASGYEEGTESTGEEGSASASVSSHPSGDQLPIPVPGQPHRAAVAVIPTGGPRGGAPSPNNSVSTGSQSYSTGTGRPSQGLTASAMEGVAGSTVRGSQLIANNPNDERMDVRNADNVTTPRASMRASYAQEADAGRVGGGGGMGQAIENAPHDEAIPVSPSVSQVATPMAMRTGQAMRPDDEDDDDEDEAEEDAEEAEEAEEEEGTEADDGREYRAEGYAGQKPTDLSEAAPVAQMCDPQLGYNPAKYSRVNATASREIQELFKQITKYEPFAAELPAKLRPFVPDYIPAIGDLDPFVKVPRPDGAPDGLGLEMVDEPAIPQSNPAVVLLELNATNAHGVAADVVDSLENAASRPEVIDRWISDIKKVHYKKALPTVNYQRPMPDIETLMQVWPQQFEEILNSDVAFPPSQIDLDLDQYVRTLCAILDIPTYTSLIDSLHVMFTLYEEFRANQHFQHV
ncbi:Intraflagellar transport complex B protein 46 C terminal [Novymonas esmeraldas]|uniref:Intraflagellar transport complex B protein 46 C terminal n=1 Tax=Novymonas esmeraldas TaxID=1808958 RepID=A0AAW0F477_9TRYP